MKKGKAAKSAVEMFCHLDGVTSREKDLIKNMSDPEMVTQMVGNCKISLPGMQKLKQESKKQKKRSK